MQIHEITRLTEAGLASALANKFMQSTLGRELDPTTLKGGQAAAVTANAPLVKQMSTELLRAWQGGALAQLMKSAAATEPGQLDKRILVDALTRQINGVLRRNYKEIEKTVDPTAFDGTAQVLARQQIEALEQAIDTAASYPPAGSGRTKSKIELAKQFNDIAAPMAVLQNISQFHSASGASGAGPRVEYNAGRQMWTVNGQPYNAQNREHKDAMDAYVNAKGLDK